MYRALVTLLAGVSIAACSEAPTKPLQPADAPPSLQQPAGSAAGADFANLGNEGVLLAPPNFTPGSCLFIPDDESLAGFIRTGPDGKQYLKVNDHSGLVVVTPNGGDTWIGTGRATIDWPNYRGDPADNVNMSVSGEVSAGGRTLSASCHYLVAAGRKIHESLTLH